jgi:outer membrane protein assembly factor BamE (lipoprotein component of BamABCDE complex)
MMKYAVAAAAFAVVAALTSCTRPAEAKGNENLQKAATFLAVSVVCEVNNTTWQSYAEVAKVETGMSRELVAELVAAKAKLIAAYVYDHYKTDEFCARGLRDMYGQ